MNDSRVTRLIFTPSIARQLLRRGCQIVDIKANREDRSRTVFVFKNDALFQDSLALVLKDRQKTEALEMCD